MITDEFQIFMREYYHSHKDKIPKHFKSVINKTVDSVLRNNPYRSSELSGALEGLRSYHIPNSGFRIIFAICEECRKENNQSRNYCPDCESIPDQSVMLFTCGPHQIYEWTEEKYFQSTITEFLKD